jgi:hypothetical protein
MGAEKKGGIVIEIVDTLPAEIQQEQSNILAIRDHAREIMVRNQGELDAASGILKEIKARRGALEDKRKEMKAPILEAGKRVDALFKPIIEELDAAERVIKTEKIQPYMDAEEQKRREAERLAQEVADKERRRIEELARKRADEERAAQEAARKAEAEGNAAEAARLQSIADAKAIKAEEFQAKADAIAAPVVAPTVQAPKGLSQSDNWTAELVDIHALIVAAAGGDRLAESMLSFNSTEANRKAKALKNSVQVQGVRFVNRPILRQGK